MGIQEKIDSYFVLCCQSTGAANFKGIAKIFWPILDNSVSLVDLSGVYTLSSGDNSPNGIDITQFSEFFHGLARLKYPFETNYCAKMVECMESTRALTFSNDIKLFMKCMDKDVTRVLLNFDYLLRRAFSSFAGQSIRLGAGLSWEEVKQLSIGMEVDGFTAFASAYSLVPGTLSLQVCNYHMPFLYLILLTLQSAHNNAAMCKRSKDNRIAFSIACWFERRKRSFAFSTGELF